MKKLKSKVVKNIVIIFIIIITIFSMIGHASADFSLFGDDSSSNSSGSSVSTSVLTALEESSADLKNMVSITDNGYEINANYALRIIKALENASVNTYAYGFRDKDYDITQVDDTSQTYKTDDQLTNIIDKYIRAELKNMLPDLGSYARTAINGNVLIKRYTAKFGTYNAGESDVTVVNNGKFDDGITLEYVPYETLKKYSKRTARSYEETQKYLKYFSINPQGMKLCVLVSNENYEWDYNNITPERAIDDSGTQDPAGVILKAKYYQSASRVSSTFEIKEYEYLNLLEQTATPINYFIAMHLITQDVDFMNEFVELCNKANSYIEVGFLESTESQFTHYNYGTGDKDIIRGSVKSTYKVDTWNRWDCCNDTEKEETYVDPIDGETKTRTVIVHNPHKGNALVNEYTGDYYGNEDELYATCLKYAGYKLKDFLNVSIKNTGDLYLIKANTWNMDYELTPTVNGVERPFKKIQKTKKIEFPSDPIKYVERLTPYPEKYIGDHCDANDSTMLYEWKNTHFYVTESSAEWTNKYNVYSVTKGGYKTDIIISLLRKYPKVENNIINASYLLFALLNQNGNTQELEKYMRYILSNMSGYEYLTDNTKNLQFNIAIGLSDDNLYSYNSDGSTTQYTTDVDSSAKSSGVSKKSGGSGKTAWHLEKQTTITTTDQDGMPISTKSYNYYKQEKGTNICGRASLATCLSGLGYSYTPTEISPKNTNAWFSWSTTLGVKATRYTNNLRGKLIEHLSTGNPAIVHIKPNKATDNVYNTTGGHFIAVVGIKYAGNVSVYVLDPGSSRSTRTENYIDINTVLAYADEIRTFSK